MSRSKNFDWYNFKKVWPKDSTVGSGRLDQADASAEANTACRLI